MPPRINVAPGDRYGRYTIKQELEKYKEKRYFLCECDCGTVKRVRFVALRSGRIKSCGCLRYEQNTTVALSHGKHKTRIYSIWHGMKQRCLNSNNSAYKFYGAKGITVCEEWHHFESFYEWSMKNGYDETFSIDRIDCAGNYEPSNCRWVTMQVQYENKAHNRFFTHNGETLLLKHWARRIGLTTNALRGRLETGWELEKALTTPPNENYRREKKC